jgi:hypothetical protein
MIKAAGHISAPGISPTNMKGFSMTNGGNHSQYIQDSVACEALFFTAAPDANDSFSHTHCVSVLCLCPAKTAGLRTVCGRMSIYQASIRQTGEGTEAACLKEERKERGDMT